ncbi:MAG: serine/threonine protein kinase [Planctomycetota bacterium]|nr:serine/threonine protein kinase [Planctomycetota bacterium]
MPVNRYDRLFAHVGSITGLLTAKQVEELFSIVETGEVRDMATAASRRGFLPADVAAAIGILASELAARRIAEHIEPDTIVGSGKSGQGQKTDTQLYPSALGQYHKLKQIARGAMGIIFRGERRSDGRVVALKVLPLQAVTDPQDVERFKREIETITSLVHPNIVRVFDFGQEEDFYYYAMEFLDGRSLRELIYDRGHLSPYHAAEIIRDAARGVAFAHQHGVIHRDLKPSNVMICKDGQVKIVDFGLAFHKTSQVLTATGISLGTPAYMSPEQIEGDRADVNERSDIYSLGVSLYEAVTGQRPFEGENQYDVMKRVLFDQPRPAALVNPSVPEELSRIAAKAMHRNPAERYHQASALIQDLDNFIDGTGR